MIWSLIVTFLWILFKAYLHAAEQEEQENEAEIRARRRERVSRRRYEQQAPNNSQEKKTRDPTVQREVSSQHEERPVDTQITGNVPYSVPVSASTQPAIPGEAYVHNQLDQRRKRLAQLIKSRFTPTELTATRYRLLIDEVRLGVLSNLARQKDLMASVAHLDRNKVELEMADADTTRKQILTQRLEMLNHVEERSAELETANEEALHVLDRAIVTLAGTPPLRGASGAHLDRSISDLENMLSQTHRRSAGSTEDEFDIEPSTKKDKDRRTITPGAS